MKFMQSIFAVCAIWIFGASIARAQTSGTLTLGDVFDTRAASRASIRMGAGYDPQGPRLIFPDTEAWKLPPTPVPTPIADAKYLEMLTRLPSIPSLSARPKADPAVQNRAGLVYRGIDSRPIGPGIARLSIETGYTHVRAEYKFVPVDGVGKELVTLHAPGTAEEFGLPAGVWRLERRLWRTDLSNSPVVTQVFENQQLISTGLYRFTTEDEDEQELLESLREVSKGRPRLRAR